MSRLASPFRRLVPVLRSSAPHLGRFAFVALNLAMMACWFASYLQWMWFQLQNYDVVLLDGSFQLYNPLRRIAAGQRGGVDFQFFHGLAIPYVHYPAFAAFGGTYASAEVVRHLYAFVAGFLAWFLPFWAASRRMSVALGLTSVALFVQEELHLHGLILPQNSLIGLRSLMPMVAFAVLLWERTWRVEAVLAGLASGSAVLLGTDHGLGCILGVAFVVLGRWWYRLPGGGGKGLALFGAVAFGTAALGFVSMAGVSGAVRAVTFALRDVPQDQFWYFGVPPNPYFDSPQRLFTDATTMPVLVRLLLALGLCAWACAAKFARPFAVLCAGWLAYAMFSMVGCLGYVSDHYTLPATRILIAMGLIVAWRGLVQARDAGPAGLALWRGAIVAEVLVALGVLVAGIGPHGSSLVKLILLRKSLAPALAEFREKPVRLSPQAEGHFAQLHGWVLKHGPQGRAPVVWSTYASLLEDRLGVFHPQCDYIIHALGPDGRGDYLARFRECQPDFAVTIRRQYTGHEEWLQAAHWPFYEELLLNYEHVGSTFAAHLWKRTHRPWRSPTHSSIVVSAEPSGAATMVPDVGLPAGGVLVVEASYGVRNSTAWLPVLGQTPRYLVQMGQTQSHLPVSLPPYRTTWSWPLRLAGPGSKPFLVAQTTGPFRHGALNVQEYRLRRTEAPPEALQILMGP